MSSSVVEQVARARKAEVTASELRVDIVDGRQITIPLSWFPGLKAASVDARANCELLADGEGIHWPDADEDFSVAGLLAGSGWGSTSKRLGSTSQAESSVRSDRARQTPRSVGRQRIARHAH